MSDISSRGAAVFLAVVGLLLVPLGGFVPSFTEAAWSDHQAVEGSFRAGHMEGRINSIYCARDATSKPHNWINLSWEKPEDLRDYDVIYDISWQDAGLRGYTGHITTQLPEFGPFFPGAEFTNHHAKIKFTIQARVAGSHWQGPPIEYSVEGPVGAGILRCG